MSGEQERVSEAVESLWSELQPVVVERVAVLRRTGAALEAGAAAPGDVEEARRIAHSLAGSLGMYGRWEASGVAADLEAVLAATVLDGRRAAALAAQLGSLLAP